MAYVRALFDNYAPRFDRHLTGKPRLLRPGPHRRGPARSLRQSHPGPSRSILWSISDAGLGSWRRPWRASFATIVGVDLSPRMLDKARRTGLYDDLHEGDSHGFPRCRGS